MVYKKIKIVNYFNKIQIFNFLFIKLEKHLNQSLNMKFEVYYVNREDENQLRKK